MGKLIHDVLNEGDEEDEMQDWVHIVNRGTQFDNNVTSNVFSLLFFFWQLKVE